MPEQIGGKKNSLVNLIVSSEGKAIDVKYSVHSIHIYKEVNRISVATIEIVDGDLTKQNFEISNKNDFKPGVTIGIGAGYGSESESIYEGVVVKHGVRLNEAGESILCLQCKDTSIKMTLGRNNANYIDSKDSDIISSLIKKYGLSADVKSSSLEHKELVQYYCTDWDFLLVRAEANGYIVCADSGVVSVKPPDVSASPELEVKFGQSIIDMDLAIESQDQIGEVQGSFWDQTEQKIVQVKAESPSVNKQGNIGSEDLSKVLRFDKVNLQSGTFIVNEEAKEWANSQLQRSWLSRIKGTLSFEGNAKAKIGTLIKLDGVGERFCGDAFISSLTHELFEGQWKTTVGIGLDSDWFIEKNSVTAPDASGLIPGVQGLQIGKVEKIDADPNGEWMIQVSVPILHAEHPGIWARLSSFYGSSECGSFFIPELDDEVVLGYLNNDPRFPIVLGSLYSSKNNMPYEIKPENTIKAIVTKEKLKIEFDDEKKKITIITPGENQVIIDDEGKSISMIDQTGNSVELSSDGIRLNSPKDISICAKGNVTIKATKNVQIDATKDIELSGLNIKQEAKAKFTAKGSASAEFSASGQTVIKGAMVMIN